MNREPGPADGPAAILPAFHRGTPLAPSMGCG